MADKKCSACGHEFPPDFPQIYAEVVKFLTENKEAAKNDRDLIQKCLKKQEGILHPKNVKYITILNLAFHVACGLNCWKEAEIFGKRAIEGFLEYYDEYSGETGVLYSLLASTQIRLEKFQAAVISANRAKVIMKVAYGEDHPSLQTLLNPLLSLIRMKKGHKV